MNIARICFAIVVLTVGALPALAVPPGFGTFRLTAAQFVANCQAMGGTSSPVESVAGTSIKCRLPSGLTVDCSFRGGEATCTGARTAPLNSLKDLLGDRPQSVNPDPAPPQSLTSSGLVPASRPRRIGSFSFRNAMQMFVSSR